MRYANVTEAREELLNIVKNGEQVTITRNGKPAVVIVPFDDYEQLAALRDATRDPDAFIEAIQAHKAVQQGKRVRDAQPLELELADRLEAMANDLKQIRSSVQQIDDRVSSASKATA